MSEKKTFYVACWSESMKDHRAVPSIWFFTNIPKMGISSSDASIGWYRAEDVMISHSVHRVLPMLYVPPGKCWRIEIEQVDENKTIIEVVDRDVKTESFLR